VLLHVGLPPGEAHVVRGVGADQGDLDEAGHTGGRGGVQRRLLQRRLPRRARRDQERAVHPCEEPVGHARLGQVADRDLGLGPQQRPGAVPVPVSTRTS
jgi:hypothetical protein